MNDTALAAVEIRRRFDAAPQRVYEAFADIHTLAELIRPERAQLVAAKADARLGGHYEIALRMAENDVWTVRGVYRELSPFRRLAMTWIWVEDDPKDEQHTLITLRFVPDGDGTELTLRHELFAREESRNAHAEGWTECLENLAARLQDTAS